MNPAGPSAPSTPVSAPAPTRRGSALSAGGSVEQRRARREQLREFYGLKGDATTPVKESGERGELGEDIRVEGRERRGAGEGKGNGKGKGKSEEDAEYQGDGVDPLDIGESGVSPIHRLCQICPWPARRVCPLRRRAENQTREGSTRQSTTRISSPARASVI
jgi:hypothetical protein